MPQSETPLNVLFLTHRLPYAPNRGDRVRAWFLLHTLRQHASVSVVSLVHDVDEAAQADRLADLVTSVHTVRVPRRRNLVRSLMRVPTSRPTTHTMLDAPDLVGAIEAAVAERRPDVVLAYCSGMARLAMMPPLETLPFVLDMVDVDSAKWAALGRISPPPMSWIYRREARVLARFESEAAAAASATLVVTPGERETLTVLAPNARIVVVPNGVDVESLRPTQPPADTATVVFCGVMNYRPNELAAIMLARDVWPLVRRARADARLQIVGAAPSSVVKALASEADGIEVTGAVADVRPYLWGAAVAAAPIETARGIQNKVLEAVAAGLPTVVTPNIMESLPDQVRRACVSATGGEEIARTLLSLLGLSPDDRRALAARADLSGLTWEAQLGGVAGLLRSAASTGRHPGAPG